LSGTLSADSVLAKTHAHEGMKRRPSPTTDKNERLRAIGLMVLATVCFAALDTTAKYLVAAKHVPVAEATWLRFVGHVVFSAAVLWPSFNFRPSLRSKKPALQLFRSVLMIVTTGFNFFALKYLQLDQTITIFFLTPLVVALLAGPLLHEWVGWHRMLAIIAGFLGVLLVMHPGFGTVHWAMLLVLVATVGYALYNLATRYLAGFDPAQVTQTYTPLAGVVLLAPLALRVWQWPAEAWLWVLFASLGFWGGLGHWMLILAHRHAPASVLAPFIYFGLIWMSLGGYLVFGDVPTLWTLSGAAVVILSGLYLLSRERKKVGPRGVGPASDIATQ
jgi:drug/metabolite transporter (DMT)-like permease